MINNNEEIIITPKNDVMFKRLFSKKGNEDLLKDFLSAILNIEIESLEVDKETHLIPEKIDEKLGILDVRAVLQDGTEIDIEVQNINYSRKEWVKVAVENNKEVKKAEEEYEYLTGDEDAKRIAFLKEKYEFDYNSGMHHARKVGLEEGRAEGIKENQKQVAKKMKEKGIDIESIIEITGLTEEEIKRL